MHIPLFFHHTSDGTGSDKTWAPARPDLPFAALVTHLATRWRRWIQGRRTLAEIETLDDATLRDIGVERREDVRHQMLDLLGDEQDRRC
jgi:uncharacterized protein YjiS (DUF1127 family)